MASATVVFPTPPLPVTMCSGTRAAMSFSLGVGFRRWWAPPTKWEYVTVPVLVHVTKQILDQWGADGWGWCRWFPGPIRTTWWPTALKRPLGDG